MDPFQSGSKDTRSQPWKQWVQEELDARKRADKTEEGRKAQENRAKAYIRKTDDDDDDDEGYESPRNKAG
ncbi:hypothetical protein F4820DRAFT_406935 [Hypoxylon rubiginosum]|uniref:Uncharacterized protein n=1 Tax=Hypoxylon rubiginosum TaxID=110542 RepID=A0ACB9ZD90_9PEZI|nr:hypothetical protein F4820DRAFT_406935 [Hypoxylon rubiginosum]